MSTAEDAARIARVYEAYANSQAFQSRWTPHNAGNRAILAERKRVIRDLLQFSPHLTRGERCVLEVGCGSGDVLATLTDVGVDNRSLWGIDLLPKRLHTAAARYPHIHFASANGAWLPFPAEQFDLVLFFTVFSSILDERTLIEVANEARRVLKTGGAVLWYDVRYNNPGNKNIRAIPRATIHRLFPGLCIELREITVLPPLARRLGPATSVLYSLLTSIPLLKTHYIGLLTKPQH